MPNYIWHCRAGVSKAKPKIRISRVQNQKFDFAFSSCYPPPKSPACAGDFGIAEREPVEENLLLGALRSLRTLRTLKSLRAFLFFGLLIIFVS